MDESDNKSSRIVLVYCIPIALANITWKMYFINGGWNVISLILIVCFP
jgi:hypothetical protein